MIPFVFRCTLIKQLRSGDQHNHVLEHSHSVPSDWGYIPGDFTMDWQSWPQNWVQQFIYSTSVTPCKAMSIMWCQRCHSTYVVPRDCRKLPSDEESIESDLPLSKHHPLDDTWELLGFRHLGSGLWKVETTSEETQLPMNSPGEATGFHHILPKNMFKNDSDRKSVV